MDGDCYIAGELPISADDEFVVPLDGGGGLGRDRPEGGGEPDRFWRHARTPHVLEVVLRRVVSNVLTRTPERDDRNVGRSGITGPGQLLRCVALRYVSFRYVTLRPP